MDSLAVIYILLSFMLLYPQALMGTCQTPISVCKISGWRGNFSLPHCVWTRDSRKLGGTAKQYKEVKKQNTNHANCRANADKARRTRNKSGLKLIFQWNLHASMKPESLRHLVRGGGWLVGCLGHRQTSGCCFISFGAWKMSGNVVRYSRHGR